ncbi:MAG: hypothetical protein RL150_208 [Candidatus Parcubacteria bacterium]|jgi:glucokinase
MVLLFDIGGTNMRFARADTLASFGDPVLVPTPGTYEDAIAEAGTILLTLAGNEPISSIVGGIAGTLDVRSGTLHASPNMRAWIGKPIVADIRRLTGADTIVLKNDADMAALGEAIHGAGRAYEHVAYLTISTGVGGGLVQQKQLFEGRYSVEPGHQFLNTETRQTLEQLLGGAHLRARYHKEPKLLGPDVYRELAAALAGGIHNLIQCWAPDVIVLGGSQTKDIPLDVVRQTVASMNVMFPYVPDIVPAELGSTNGLFGALAYARQLASKVE